MIEIKRKENCCGCNACGDVCPYDAISFTKDIEDFEYPVVDKEKCIDCHLCEKVCPVINIDKLKQNDYEQPHCYAAIHKNIETRFDSTSGGIFSALAEAMYKQGGYVGGAVWIENDWHVEEYISNNPEDLPRLRSSKYLQSLSEGFYKRIKNLLKAGEKVLVCGTPCQMAALRSFLNYTNYENLIIVDFICLGVNSPLIWRRYLDFREKQNGGRVVYVKPKNKEMGWRKLTTKLIFDNGKVLYDTRDISLFTKGYIVTHAFCRPSCYDCHFKGFPRMADITIADFWGGEKVVGADLDNDMGTSLVMINSQKGENYYESIKNKILEKEVPFNSILSGNTALLEPIPKPDIIREDFYRDLTKLDFGTLSEKYHFDFPKNITLRRKIRHTYHFLYDIKKACRWNIALYVKNFYHNFLDRRFVTSPFNGDYVIRNSYVVFDIDKTARITVHGAFKIGRKMLGFRKSKLETRIHMAKNARIIIDDWFNLSYGADLEVFENASLHIRGRVGSNIGLTLICGKEIDIGQGVQIGRNCTIRDNNGDHYIARRGYKNAHTVKIGQHCWLCEGCTIVGGSKLGDCVIVGAKAVVFISCPSFTMVSGNPAQIVDENVYWKY